MFAFWLLRRLRQLRPLQSFVSTFLRSLRTCLRSLLASRASFASKKYARALRCVRWTETCSRPTLQFHTTDQVYHTEAYERQTRARCSERY